MRITALTCASILSIISIGASPFKINDMLNVNGKVTLSVPEVEMDSFNLDGGVAGITEKDIYVEAVEKNAKKSVEKEAVVEEVVEEIPESTSLWPMFRTPLT